MSRIDTISIALAAGHPTTGPYNIDDALAASEGNAKNLEGDTDVSTLFNYMLMQKTHSTDGNDGQARSLWIRIKEVAAMEFTETGSQPNPWGSTAIGVITEIQWVKCKTLLEYFTLASQGNLPLSLKDSNFAVFLGGAVSAGCMTEAHKDEIIALSDNKTSHSAIIGVGRWTEGDIQMARAI